MILRASGITVTFDGFRAVEDAAVAVPEGGMAGLVGPNGAGKSSLFGALTGYVPAIAGSVRIAGADVSRLPPHRRVRRGLARTFQVPREFTHLSVRDNLAAAVPAQPGERLWPLFARPGSVARGEAAVRRRVDEVLAIVGLANVAGLHAGGLSGGQRKLLELGRALLTEPRIILLDEPFGGVNPVMIEHLCEVILGLNRSGIAFLIVEHNLGALTRLVSTLFVMDQGRVIAEGSPATVFAMPAVQGAYLGALP